MSRAERRQYQRLAKGQDPYAVRVAPGAQRRAEKLAARRAAQRRDPPGSFTGRYVTVVLAGAAIAGLGAFSLAWPNGVGVAWLAGGGVAALWIVATVGMRLLQRRSAGR